MSREALRGARERVGRAARRVSGRAQPSAVVGALALVGALAWPGATEAQSWREVTTSRQLEGLEEVRVDVSYGAGTFALSAAEQENLLYRMSLRYDEEAFEPVTDFSGGRLRIGLETVGGGFSFKGKRDGGSMELELARGVPMDLDLEFGAVQADLDFGGLALTDLSVQTGASESRIDVSEPNPTSMERAQFEVGAADFTMRRLGNLGAERIEVAAGVGEVKLWLDGRWRTDARLSVDMGLGALELHVPEGLGIRVRKDSFLTSFDPEGLVKRGEAYYSLDWEEADRKVTIDLDAAFGSVKVVWIR